MSRSEIGTVRLFSSLAFLFVVGLALVGCSGDDSDNARRTGAGQTFCADGMDSCNGVCVILSTDAANCGTCGAACDAGQNCVEGACALDPQAATGGSSSVASATGGAMSTGGTVAGGGLVQ
jgi:hypothetical protein